MSFSVLTGKSRNLKALLENISGEIHILQCGIASAGHDKRSSSKATPAISDFFRDFIATELQGDLVIVTINYFCGINSVVFSERGVDCDALTNGAIGLLRIVLCDSSRAT